MEKSQWNHNNHYHKEILKQIPIGIKKSLDIGCGEGEFAAMLSQRSKSTIGIDSHEMAISKGKKDYQYRENLLLINDNFMNYDFREELFDAITCIATLHHLETEKALVKMKKLLAPGGTLIILGLYKESSLADFFWSLMSIPLNLLFQIKNRKKKNAGVPMKVQLPKQSIRDLKNYFKSILPEAKFARKLFWRYMLVWNKK